MIGRIVHVITNTNFKERRRSPDEPCPTILTAPASTAGSGWIEVKWEDEEMARQKASSTPRRQSHVEKPPYRVPTMEEIEQVRATNGLKVVSTFSGCGGSCLGFEMAGYEIMWASEFIAEARDTYVRNHSDVHVDARDIRTVKSEDILARIGLEPGDIDVLEGSPPCASFSMSGKRSKGWGDQSTYSSTKQRTDDLFWEFARIVRGLQPKVFVAENVSGLVKGVAKGYFKLILAELRECGYIVEARLLDASWLGVPQVRQRIIFMGVRKDLGLKPVFPTPMKYQYNVRDALPWIIQVKHGGKPDNWKTADRPCSTIVQSGHSLGETGYLSGGTYVESQKVKFIEDSGGDSPKRHKQNNDFSDKPAPTVRAKGGGQLQVEYPNDVQGLPNMDMGMTGVDASDPEVFDRYAIANDWDKMPPGSKKGKYLNSAKPDITKPCPTITAGNGVSACMASVMHPTERRKFTIAELRRICGFPDDFELTGTYSQRWERLGRAVPPVMMSKVAEVIRDEILGKL